MKLDDGRLSFVAQQEVTALDAIHKAVLGKAACAGRVTEDVGACISIHAPTWGATDNIVKTLNVRAFQSTHPRGVRRRSKSYIYIRRYFNPRTHVGCDGPTGTAISGRLRFQSTHPRGVRRVARSYLLNLYNFNPRTHVGCDFPGSR